VGFGSLRPRMAPNLATSFADHLPGLAPAIALDDELAGLRNHRAAEQVIIRPFFTSRILQGMFDARRRAERGPDPATSLILTSCHPTLVQSQFHLEGGVPCAQIDSRFVFEVTGFGILPATAETIGIVRGLYIFRASRLPSMSNRENPA